MSLEIQIAFEPSWLENLAIQLADSLQLTERRRIPTGIYFEDSRIVVKRGFSASGRNFNLSYDKRLNEYNSEGENSESQRAVKEIADILDIPVGTVKSRLHYGRLTLKKKLELQKDILPDFKFESP